MRRPPPDVVVPGARHEGAELANVDAGDVLGVPVEDACAATSAERHAAALRTLRGFARVRSTGEVVGELGRAARS